MKMLLFTLLTFNVKLDIGMFNTVKRWYFANDNSYFITSDYVLKIEYESDSVIVDTVKPIKMRGLFFVIDTFYFYLRHDGVYLNNNRLLDKRHILDVTAGGNWVAFLTRDTVYLLWLLSQKIDTLYFKGDYLSITPSYIGFYLISPSHFRALYYDILSRKRRTILLDSLKRYLPSYGIAESGRGKFLKGGIVGISSFRGENTNMVAWGFYYRSVSNKPSDQKTPETAIFLLKTKNGRIMGIDKVFKFDTPVYPVMIKGKSLYFVRFNFRNAKREIEIWKAI